VLFRPVDSFAVIGPAVYINWPRNYSTQVPNGAIPFNGSTLPSVPTSLVSPIVPFSNGKSYLLHLWPRIFIALLSSAQCAAGADGSATQNVGRRSMFEVCNVHYRSKSPSFTPDLSMPSLRGYALVPNLTRIMPLAP